MTDLELQKLLEFAGWWTPGLKCEAGGTDWFSNCIICGFPEDDKGYVPPHDMLPPTLTDRNLDTLAMACLRKLWQLGKPKWQFLYADPRDVIFTATLAYLEAKEK